MQPFQPLNVKVEPKTSIETQPQHTITSVAAAAAAAVSAAVAAEQAAAAEKAALTATATAGGGGVERVPHFSQISVSDVEPKRGLKRAAESPLPVDIKSDLTAFREDMIPERMQLEDQSMFKVRVKVSEFYSS